MAKKKKIQYPEGVRNWKIVRQQWIKDRLNFVIQCPFCLFNTRMDVKACAKTGKKCTKCKGHHWMSGYTARGYSPQASGVEQTLNSEESRNKIGLES